MTDELTIRDMREDERDDVRAVTLAAYEEYAKLMPPTIWERYREASLQTLDDIGAAECIVAERQGSLVGSVLLYPASVRAYGSLAGEALYPEVRLLAVIPAARGLKIGKALMHECEQRARRSGADAIGLHTMDIMQTAIKMYEQMGYVRAPEMDFTPAPNLVVKGYRRTLV